MSGAITAHAGFGIGQRVNHVAQRDHALAGRYRPVTGTIVRFARNVTDPGRIAVIVDWGPGAGGENTYRPDELATAPPPVSLAVALDQIAAELDGAERDEGTLDRVADIVRGTGRVVGDVTP